MNSTSKPNSSATIAIASLSSRLLMVAMSPSRMQVAITSCGFTSMRLASSATVMNSVARMVRTSSAATSPLPSSRRRWRRRVPVSRLAKVLRTLSSTSFSSTTFFFLRSRRLKPRGSTTRGCAGRTGAPADGPGAGRVVAVVAAAWTAA